MSGQITYGCAGLAAENNEELSYSLFWKSLNILEAVVESDSVKPLDVVHLEVLSSFRQSLVGLLFSRDVLLVFVRKQFSISWLRWNLTLMLRRIQGFPRKSYIAIRKSIRWGDWNKMSVETNAALQKFFADMMSDKNLETLRSAFKNLTELEIVTKGKTEEVKTTISVLGDITSSAPMLSGDKLLAYHENMSRVSVDIMKTYAIILAQVVSLFVPFAGLSLPANFQSNIEAMIKTFNLSAPSKTP